MYDCDKQSIYGNRWQKVSYFCLSENLDYGGEGVFQERRQTGFCYPGRFGDILFLLRGEVLGVVVMHVEPPGMLEMPHSVPIVTVVGDADEFTELQAFDPRLFHNFPDRCGPDGFPGFPVSFGQVPHPIPVYKKKVAAPVGNQPSGCIHFLEFRTQFPVHPFRIFCRDIDSAKGFGRFEHIDESMETNLASHMELDGVGVGQSLVVRFTNDYATFFKVNLVHYFFYLCKIGDSANLLKNMAHYESKHGKVSRNQVELYMSFVDLRNFATMLPPEYKDSVRADYDTLTASVKGMPLSIRVDERRPYDRIRVISENSPVEFCILLHFDSCDDNRTDFSIELDANLNIMLKAMLGGKLTEALDKIVDGLVAVSEGRMPEGMPSSFKPEDFR